MWDKEDFRIGQKVLLRGLQGRSDLNGRYGRIINKDGASGRFMVDLSSEKVKVKPINIVPVTDKEKKDTGREHWWGSATAEKPKAALQKFIDSARLRVEDEYVMLGDVVGAYAEAAGETGAAMRWFRRYLKAAKLREVLPAWWTEETTEKLFWMISEKSAALKKSGRHGCYLHHAIEEHDAIAVWGRKGVSLLRSLATSILGPLMDPFSEEDWLEEDSESEIEESDYSETSSEQRAEELRLEQRAASQAAAQARRLEIQRTPELRTLPQLKPRWSTEVTSPKQSDADVDAPACLEKISHGHLQFVAAWTDQLKSSGRYWPDISLVRFVQDSALSKIVESDTGNEIAASQVDAVSVTSIMVKAFRDDCEITFSGMNQLDVLFPNLRSFSYEVQNGYGRDYDLSGLASLATSLKVLKLALGPCHLGEQFHQGLSVLKPLTNLEVFEVSGFRHAYLPDIQVVENFHALQIFSWEGAVRITDMEDDEGSDTGSSGFQSCCDPYPILDLTSLVQLRRLRLASFDGSGSFCAPGQLCTNPKFGDAMIQLLLPHLSSSQSKLGDDVFECEISVEHQGAGMLSSELRALILQSPRYKLHEFMWRGEFNINNGSSKLEAHTAQQLDAIWHESQAKAKKEKVKSLKVELASECRYRAGVVGLYACGESCLDPALFPAAQSGQVSSGADIQKWVNSYHELSVAATKLDKGDRCFILTLMENICGWPDHVGSWIWTDTDGSGSGSVDWSMDENNMLSMMQKGGKGSKGLFMVEALVEKVSSSARIKLQLSEDSVPKDSSSSHRPEYEYDVKVIKPADDDGTTDTLTATVHESLLFAEIPAGWTRSKEIYSMNCSFDGSPSTKQVRFYAYFPEEGVLLKNMNQPPCDHCGRLGKLMCMPCRARGKQVWYCNAACQRASWLLHKRDCIGCVLCGAQKTETKCSKCSSPYCSTACLEKDWPQHKHLCKAPRTAKA